MAVKSKCATTAGMKGGLSVANLRGQLTERAPRAERYAGLCVGFNTVDGAQ